MLVFSGAAKKTDRVIAYNCLEAIQFSLRNFLIIHPAYKLEAATARKD